ncbi:MAG: ABC transporter permease [Bacteroidetes bacterium]|nr:ABC transporter permease [Bacteroidota bacterium]MBS1933678.1 ABC transporter permease [Bacteroidota bacterium]
MLAAIIKTEWLKIKRYPAFWWIMGITALTYPGINYMFYRIYLQVTSNENQAGKLVKTLLGNPFALPEGWRTIAYFSSLFIFIPAIVIIMLITNEYSYKTNRQNIIDGWSRKNFMTGKLVDVLILSLIVTALYTVVVLVMGFSNTTDANADKWHLVYYIGLFALQSFSQLSLAFLVGFLVRRSFIALAIFAFYFIVLEPIAVNVLKYKFESNAGEYFPLEISHKLLPRPAFFSKIDSKGYQGALDAINRHIGYTLALVAITWVLCFWINNKRDL